jgi:hypothetical protein
MTSQEELKPCGCGASARVEKRKGRWYVECSAWPVKAFFGETEQQAIAAWNRRSKGAGE